MAVWHSPELIPAQASPPIAAEAALALADLTALVTLVSAEAVITVLMAFSLILAVSTVA